MRKLAIVALMACSCASSTYQGVHKVTRNAIGTLDDIVLPAHDAYVKAKERRIERCTGLGTEEELFACMGKFNGNRDRKIMQAISMYVQLANEFDKLSKKCGPATASDERAKCIIRMQASFSSLVREVVNFAKENKSEDLLKKIGESNVSSK